MFLNKRSVSPLIATILIIVVSVILITVILTWGSDFAKEKLSITQSPAIQNTDFTGLITNRALSAQNILISNNHSSRDLNITGYKLIASLDNDLYSYFENKIYYLEEPLVIGSKQSEVLQIDCYPEESFFIDLITDQNTYVRTQVNLRSAVGTKYELVMEFTDNASDSSTLRLNNGGDFAVVDWTGNSDFQEIGTSLETESPVIPSTVKIFAKNGVLTYFYSANNNFSFDIANLPSDLTYYFNTGSNTTTGDIANLPSMLTYYYNRGSNTTTGDIANLPSGLTYYYNRGSNTTTGDIANLPSGLTFYRNYGYNTTTGDIANLPSDLDTYYNAGSNTTTGDIANLPSKLTYYYNGGNNQVNTYTAGRVWANNMQYFKHLPAAGYGLSSTDVDNLLIDLANVTTWAGEKVIDLSGNNAAPGPLGEAAIDTLRHKGVSVKVTGGY